MSSQIGMYIYHSDCASVLAVQCISGGQGNKEKSWSSEIRLQIKYEDSGGVESQKNKQKSSAINRLPAQKRVITQDVVRSRINQGRGQIICMAPATREVPTLLLPQITLLISKGSFPLPAERLVPSKSGPETYMWWPLTAAIWVSSVGSDMLVWQRHFCDTVQQQRASEQTVSALPSFQVIVERMAAGFQ